MSELVSPNQGRYRSHGHYVSERQKRLYFQRVIAGYRATRELSPIVAINYDPELHPHKLGPETIHFLTDIELATKKAVKTQELFRQWQALVDEKPVDPAIAARITSACGAEYMKRKLTPSDYFRHIKTRPERRAA
jgi:hypothetical protein